MVEKKLTARLGAVDSISDTLDSIANSSLNAAEGMTLFGESSEETGDEVEDTEDEVSDFSDTLNDLIDNALTAAESLNLTAEQEEEVGDEAAKAQGKVAGLVASLKTLDSIDDIEIDVEKEIVNTNGDGGGENGGINIPTTDSEVLRHSLESVRRYEGFNFREEFEGGDAEDLYISLRENIGLDGDFDRVAAREDAGDIQDLFLDRNNDIYHKARQIKDYLGRGEQFIANDHAEGEVRRLGKELGSKETSHAGIRDIWNEFDNFEDATPHWTENFLSSEAFNPDDSVKRGELEFGDWGIFEKNIDFEDRIREAVADGGFRGVLGLTNEINEDTKGLSSNFLEAGKALSVVGELGKGLAQVAGVSRNIAGLSRIASAFGSIGSLGGLVGSLAGIAVAFGLVGASITSVVGAIGGLITAVGGLAASLAGLVGVGLFQKGKQFNAKNPLKGIGEYLKTFQDDVKKALQPIFSLPAGEFVEGFLEGGIKTLRQYSEMVKQLWPDISGMFDRLGEAFSANSPEFFAQLEKTIRAFLPMIEGFISWFIKSAPTALKTMRKIGVKLIPKIARMFGSLWGMIEPLLPSGTALVSILVDLVTIFAEILTPVSEILGLALNPFLMTLAWGLDKIADLAKWASDGLSDFMDGINKWIDGIWQAMKDISLLEFGKILWNLTIGAFESLTNAVIKGIQGMLNFVYKMVRKHVPGAGEAMTAANAAAKAAGKDKPFPDKVKLGTVSFSGMKADVNTGVDGMQTAASAATEPGSDLQSKGDKNKQDEGGDVYNIGPINADGDTNKAIIRQAIRQGVEDAKDESRNREGGY